MPRIRTTWDRHADEPDLCDDGKVVAEWASRWFSGASARCVGARGHCTVSVIEYTCAAENELVVRVEVSAQQVEDREFACAGRG